MGKQTVYIIIPTANIGGAEKRFVELWIYMQEHQQSFDFKLIVSQQLHEALYKNEYFSSKLLPLNNRIFIFDIDFNLPVIQFQKEFYEYIKKQTTSGDVLHYVLSFPTFVFPLLHKKTLYSLTESSLKNVNIFGKILYALNVLRTRHADILDPVVHKTFSRLFFFRKKNIHLTPGSFVDTDVFKPEAGLIKENWFVFLGRFFWVKQVLKLLQTLPEVCQRLDDSELVKGGYKFIFLGYGQQEEEIKQMISSPEFKNLPIEIRKTYTPETVLNRSKVIFSLQLRNNYPSKSLLEAMAAGNIPLVTDVGTTRNAAIPECSYYVPEDFTKADMADRLLEILSLKDDELQTKMDIAREFIINNFTIETSAGYYSSIYKKFDVAL